MATTSDQQREIEALRARVAELERELAEQAARANNAIAAAQERAYWLDRWHVDLNALMEKPGASQFRAVLRAIRAVYRPIAKLVRPLRRR
jgi:cell division septum initiation protein DivIVA